MASGANELKVHYNESMYRYTVQEPPHEACMSARVLGLHGGGVGGTTGRMED